MSYIENTKFLFCFDVYDFSSRSNIVIISLQHSNISSHVAKAIWRHKILEDRGRVNPLSGQEYSRQVSFWNSNAFNHCRTESGDYLDRSCHIASKHEFAINEVIIRVHLGSPADRVEFHSWLTLDYALAIRRLPVRDLDCYSVCIDSYETIAYHRLPLFVRQN